jgi:hypothetical protein
MEQATVFGNMVSPVGWATIPLSGNRFFQGLFQTITGLPIHISSAFINCW